MIWIKYRHNSSASKGVWKWKALDFSSVEEAKKHSEYIEEYIQEMYRAEGGYLWEDHYRGFDFEVVSLEDTPYKIIVDHYNSLLKSFKRLDEQIKELAPIVAGIKMIEIERKFLINPIKLNVDAIPVPAWQKDCEVIWQSYLSDIPVVRVRTSTTWLNNEQHLTQSFMTVKGEGLLARKEIEFLIDNDQAKKLHKMAKWTIEKNRYRIGRWEIDWFNDGQWLAEIELADKNEEFDKPDWLLDEVTFNPRFTNINLAKNGWPESSGAV